MVTTIDGTLEDDKYNEDDNIRNMCKNYFLLESSLENDYKFKYR